MNRLFRLADAWARESSWEDLAVLKICLCAMGVAMGCAVPRRRRKAAAMASLAVFSATYVPLMASLLHVARQKELWAEQVDYADQEDHVF